MNAERRLFQTSTAWFVGGLITGLWLLVLYARRDGLGFSQVRDLHVALILQGWLAMALAAGGWWLTRRSRGRLASEPLALAAIIVWNLWCCGVLAAYALPHAPLLASLLGFVFTAALALAALAALPACLGWPASLALVLSLAAAGLLTLPGAQLSFPGLGPLEAAAAVVGAAACGYVWRRRSAWLAALWAIPAFHWLAGAAGLALVLAVAATVAALLALRPARGAAATLAAFALLVVCVTAGALAAAVPVTPLGVAASLSSAVLAFLYSALPRLLPPRAAQVHAWLHVSGFAALAVGFQFGWMALAWPGALGVVAGALLLMANLVRPAMVTPA